METLLNFILGISLGYSIGLIKRRIEQKRRKQREIEKGRYYKIIQTKKWEKEQLN
ncbi:MAG: hypothetical protein ACRBFS_24385 [Aureispira sp.]